MFEFLIGLPLDEAKKELERKGLSYNILNNNYNVVGDHTIVTNVKQQNNELFLIVGEFIFNLKREAK